MVRLWFWIAVGFPVYVYFGYPILLWGLQAIFGFGLLIAG